VLESTGVDGLDLAFAVALLACHELVAIDQAAAPEAPGCSPLPAVAPMGTRVHRRGHNMTW
jgi:hypothetical protein